jgi:hypothetical protein
MQTTHTITSLIDFVQKLNKKSLKPLLEELKGEEVSPLTVYYDRTEAQWKEFFGLAGVDIFNHLHAKEEGLLTVDPLPTHGIGGRSFENTFRTSFIKALYNGGKGLTVSNEYFQPDKASRKYTNTTHPKLMENFRKQLLTLGWGEKQLKFEEIEIDCVLRCYVDLESLEGFDEPAKILLPIKKMNVVSPQAFTRKISDNSIDGELQKPNSYIVVEITASSANLEQKLIQLEKDLLLLLLKHHEEQNTILSKIESTISFTKVRRGSQNGLFGDLGPISFDNLLEKP